MRILLVEGDTNDGDFIDQQTDITKFSEKKLNDIRRIFKIISECKESHNWDTTEFSDITPEVMYKDKLSKRDFNLMEDIIPWDEHGIHTITSVEILDVVEKIL
jgi:DNA-binding transcriptional regulator GbsR (MarR family)